jgi:hypothetical protein
MKHIHVQVTLKHKPLKPSLISEPHSKHKPLKPNLNKKTHLKHKPLKCNSATETHSKHKPLHEFKICDHKTKQPLKHEAYSHLGPFET